MIWLWLLRRVPMIDLISLSSISRLSYILFIISVIPCMLEPFKTDGDPVTIQYSLAILFFCSACTVLILLHILIFQILRYFCWLQYFISLCLSLTYTSFFYCECFLSVVMDTSFVQLMFFYSFTDIWLIYRVPLKYWHRKSH